MRKAVHTDDPPTLYVTITVDASGAERQTPADRLFQHDKVHAAAASSSAASASAQDLAAGNGPAELLDAARLWHL